MIISYEWKYDMIDMAFRAIDVQGFCVCSFSDCCWITYQPSIGRNIQHRWLCICVLVYWIQKSNGNVCETNTCMRKAIRMQGIVESTHMSETGFCIGLISCNMKCWCIAEWMFHVQFLHVLRSDLTVVVDMYATNAVEYMNSSSELTTNGPNSILAAFLSQLLTDEVNKKKPKLVSFSVLSS